MKTMLSHFLRKLGTLAPNPPRSAVVKVRSGGMVWTIPQARAEWFADGEPDLVAWTAAGRLIPVKQNLQRTISRIELPKGIAFVKLCRANTPRSWARELLRPAKARLEFENALTLRERGIPTIEPLACGVTPGPLPGTSILITRGHETATPFAQFLAEILPTLPPNARRAIRRQLAKMLAAFLAKMHDAGVSHPDPHPGNFLLELPPNRIPKFTLIDLHAIRFGAPLTWAETRENLTLMNRWFQLRGTRADRLRFWKAYLLARTTLNPDTVTAKRMGKELERATERSNGRFWASRLDRYTTNNREFQRVRGSSCRGFAVRDLPDDVRRDWLANLETLFTQPGSELLKDSRSSTVVRFTLDTPDGPRSFVAKRFRLKSPADAVKNLFRRSEALRSWILGHSLRDRGLPTPRPLLMLHRRRFGFPTEGIVIFEAVPDSLGLPEALASLTEPNRYAAIRAGAERLGRLLRLMHDREVSHRDLKAPNLLFAEMSDPENAEPVLIDLVGVRAGSTVPRAVRVRDLARLAASFHGSTAISRTDRLRVLRAYLCWALHGTANWKHWWGEIDAALREKVAKNERSGRPLG